MKPVAFDYCQPDTVAEVAALLAEHGEDAAILSGGLSMGPMLNMRLMRPSLVVDVNRVAGLGAVEIAAGQVRTGALLRQADAMANAGLLAAVPMLSLALPHVGHYQTRNRGTFGGSIAHADPSAELPLCLLTCGGSVELTSAKGTRTVPAFAFFQGPLTTARRPDELLSALLWPVVGARTGHAFDEIAQRHGDFAIAAAACSVTLAVDGTITALSLGLGGVADRPILVDTSAVISRPPDATLIEEASTAAMAQATPESDLLASADYRRALVGQLAGRVLRAALEAAT